MSTAGIPEPIAQLQRQLDEIRGTQTRVRKLPESVWQTAVDSRNIGIGFRNDLLQLSPVWAIIAPAVKTKTI
jgi:hypothetical protein